MFSFGSKSHRAFTTVRPPMPESKTPMDRESLMQPGKSSQWRHAATNQRLSISKGEGRVRVDFRRVSDPSPQSSPFTKGEAESAAQRCVGNLQTSSSLG